MKAARLRIAGEGEFVKEWKRLFGLRSTLEESFLLLAGAVENGGTSLAGCPDASNAVFALLLVD
jgi:hypothetical protein